MLSPHFLVFQWSICSKSQITITLPLATQNNCSNLAKSRLRCLCAKYVQQLTKLISNYQRQSKATHATNGDGDQLAFYVPGPPRSLVFFTIVIVVDGQSLLHQHGADVLTFQQLFCLTPHTHTNITQKANKVKLSAPRLRQPGLSSSIKTWTDPYAHAQTGRLRSDSCSTDTEARRGCYKSSAKPTREKEVDKQ